MQPSDFDGWVAGNAGGELLKPAATETLQVSRESVSFTDMKTGINILGTLQFRLVMHMSRIQRPAQRRLLDHIMC
jgi:hypothetical protein